MNNNFNTSLVVIVLDCMLNSCSDSEGCDSDSDSEDCDSDSDLEDCDSDSDTDSEGSDSSNSEECDSGLGLGGL